MGAENKESLTEGSILKPLIKFAFPVYFAMLLSALYGAVDMMIVGRFASVAEQSGVSTGSMFVMMPHMFIAGLTIGVTVYIGGCIGRKDMKAASRGVGTTICLFVLIAVVLTAIMVPFAPQIANLMGAPVEAYGPTVSYLRIVGIGQVFVIGYTVVGALFRGLGDSKTPLLVVVIACIVNIFADLVLVAGLNMGAAGAAIATAGAQALSIIISLIIVIKRGLPFKLTWADIRFNGIALKKILMVGVPDAIQETLVQVSFLYLQAVVNSMGVVQSAAMGIGEKVAFFLSLTGFAFMQAMAAFTAQNMGAGQRDRAKKGLRICLSVALGMGVIMGLLAFFLGSIFSSLFTHDAAVIEAAGLYLRAYSMDCFLTSFFALTGYLIGCEKSIFVMAQGLIGAFLVRVPVIYIMSKLPGTTMFHVGLGTPASTLVQVFMCVGAFIIFEKKALKMVDEPQIEEV